MSEEVRTQAGQWLSGVSGNPGGYSKEKRKAVARVAVLAAEHTEDAIKTLAGIMMDEKATRSTRIAAANALLDRAHGKPPQSVGVDVLGFCDLNGDFAEFSTLEIGRRIAFALQQGAAALEEKQQERAAATDAEIASNTQIEVSSYAIDSN